MTDAEPGIADHVRMRVREMAAVGTPPNTIRLLVTSQLKLTEFIKAFEGELLFGGAEADARVAATLYDMAQSGKNLSATLAWARQRLGWRNENEASGHDAEDTTSELGEIQALLDQFAASKEGCMHAEDALAGQREAQPAAATG